MGAGLCTGAIASVSIDPGFLLPLDDLLFYFHPMHYRNLAGLRVSEIGIGAWQLGGPLVLDGITDGHPDLGREFCVDLMRRCKDELGINFVDTAEQYGNGESERRVGEAIKGQRDQWVVGSKFGNQVGPNGERLKDASPKRVPVSLEGTLKRLGTDYVDVYVYHIAPVRGEAEEVAEFLAHAKQRGLVRAVGISTNNLEEMDYLHSLGCLDIVQFAHSMMSSDDSILNLLQKTGAGAVVRGAFEGGRLSGRYFRQPPRFSRDDIRSVWINPVAAAEEFARYSLFEELLRPDLDMVAMALRYLLDLPMVSTIIPGGKSFSDYQKAARASEIPPLAQQERSLVVDIRNRILGAQR